LRLYLDFENTARFFVHTGFDIGVMPIYWVTSYGHVPQTGGCFGAIATFAARQIGWQCVSRCHVLFVSSAMRSAWLEYNSNLSSVNAKT
jgi:hypothetical protein